ncbi:MATE family efflux transporter [Cloacibacillus sp.]|uniref:MATE family efflux transporter n=1 Tax=Cloacibacillus sp. TaxID=2049023 RepID=UPI0025C14735|nr:MATE family efflux transporter [Cloacibacillus sp.]MCC8057748.1 MATE family efflux transporter [Cloacibacillus sp.]
MKLFVAPSKDSAEHHSRMTEAPVGPLIISLAIPTIISMLVTTLYNTADTYFVSQLGTSASGAVGVVFSLMAIFQAIGFTLGMGSGSMIARVLGAGESGTASVYGLTSFFSAITMGILLCVGGLLFLDKLMTLLGSTPTILPYARSYASWILLGAPIMCASFVMNNILRSEGHAAFAMCGLVTGGLLNIALDPIFIFTLGLGISGAALATLLSQCISFSIMISFFLRGKSLVRLHLKNLSHKPRTYFDIVRLGCPSLSRQGLASISTAALNVSAAAYGDPAVAAMSIVGRIFLFILSVMIGLGQGFSPVVGYNYGSRRYGRVREAFWFTVKTGMVLMAFMTLAGWIFAPDIIALFRKEDAVAIAIGTRAMRFQCSVLLLQPLFVTTNMMLQASGFAWRATFLACTRQGIYFIPLIALLPGLFGLTGVEMTQTVSDIFSFTTSLPFLYYFIVMLKEKERFQ